jgi:pyrroloquinoline quinone biosynthesis protein D
VNGPRIAPKARLKWDPHEDRYLLLYPERGLALSDSAAAILKLCDGTHSLDAIVFDLVQNRPGSDPSTIRADVLTFLQEMRRRGLVVD